MSMTTLITLQFIGMFVAYIGITVALPAVMFRRILKGRRISEQFLMSYTFGNFYIINIVFALQLLHISNFYTLTFLTAGLSLFIWSRVNRISLKSFARQFGKDMKKLLDGSLGIRSALGKVKKSCHEVLRYFMGVFYREIVKKPVQVILFFLVFVAMFWIYGRQLFLAYGYRASDIPVHLNWINQMSRDNLFASGVYPFGFHCIVYFMHTVFRFDTYVIMCQFFFAQVIFIHLVLLATLKLLCKTSYLPYAGVLVYILGDFWSRQTYTRFYSTLPQEYGMIFIIPSVYFLIRFFQLGKEELKSKEATIQLQCFAMAFGLTLAIHFYGTMIAGICCVGIGLGFGFRFFRKEYFWRIIVTGILSIVIAILPMGIAFATGTPLQGSIGWGLSVIQSSSSEEEAEEPEEDAPIQENPTQGDFAGEMTPSTEEVPGETVTGDPTATPEGDPSVEMPEEPHRSIKERLFGAVEILIASVHWNVFDVDRYNDLAEPAAKILVYAMPAMLVMGLFYCIVRKVNYGGTLLSVGGYMGLLLLLLGSGNLGLPTLMDATRCSVYFVYLLVTAVVLLADSIVYLILMPTVLRLIRNTASLGVLAAAVAGLFHCGLVRAPQYSSGYVTNGAIICLDNIIHDNEDMKWTIVSANDERQMGLDRGWHYELIDFLRKLERIDENTKINIPTEKVYFFVEKVPLDYYQAYDKSGQCVSKKGASQILPGGASTLMYQGENRWIVMSKMYFWVQAFQEKYPNEMKVYYESDEFICYVLEQNTYHQYNLAIDYGFNQVITQEANE